MARSRVSQKVDPIAAATIAFNIATLKGIPQSELPDPAARAALIELAETGAEVYAYTPGCSHQHVIWLRPQSADVDGRMTCAEWQAIYQQEASEEVLATLIPALRQAQQARIRIANAFLDHQIAPPSYEELDTADSRVRDLEQRVRLTRWRLSAKGTAA